MRRVLASRAACAAAAGILVLLLAGGGYAIATSTGTITVCVRHSDGTLYKARTCKKHDKPLTWNIQGVPGKNGTNGTNGTNGSNGTNGTSGTNGTNGVNGASAGLNDFNDGPVIITTAGEHVVATMSSVPAGNYILTGKLEVTNNATPLFVDCFLRAGADFDESRAELAASGAGSTETLPFTVSHTFASTGTVTLSCNGFGNTIDIFDAKISAVQVQTLTKTSG
jgi:hypothetical protein